MGWKFLQRLVFADTWRIVLLGYRNQLELSSLNLLREDLKASAVTAALKEATAEKQKLSAYVYENDAVVETHALKRRSLSAVLFKVCRWEVLASAILEFFWILMSFVPPLMLGYLLVYIEEKQDSWHGYAYASAYAFSQLVGGMLNAHAAYLMALGGYKVQSALTSALYKKVLRISSSSRRQYTAGEIMNLMSVDVEQVGQFLLLCHNCWGVPLRIVLTMVFLWKYLGPSSLATLATMLASTLATTCVAHFCDKYQKRQMDSKDLRLRQTTEVLNGIKVIKLNAWEPPFMEKVKRTRAEELSSLKKYAILQSTFAFVWSATPNAAALASFGTFLLVSPANQLTPSIAFTCLSLFMLLRFPMYILPDVLSRLIRCLGSLKRLSAFLEEAELDEKMIGASPDKGDAVSLKGASFTWASEEPAGLRDLTLNVKEGSLVAVVGPVGCGKSTLLNAILGTLEKVSGSVDVQGRLAYVAQQSWIQNATVKENIIFTNTANEERYQQVVEACALRPDLEMLPAGENTEVGDKGINLSGGQKLRISLARAVYHDADVYLLDDPFSAVDVHVASHLFEHVVGPTGALKSKTRILVTHSVTVLPQVDWIVLLDKGGIKEQGTYRDLLENDGSDFSAFLKKHAKKHSSSSNLKATAKTERPNEESVEKDVIDEAELADEERMNTGSVKWNIYAEYLNRAGWKFLVPAIIAIFVAYCFEYGSGLWLSEWSSHPDPFMRATYMVGFGALLVGMSIFNFIYSVLFVLGSMRTASSIHSQLLQSVMRSPISFFDKTSMGRIVNRFSRDVDLIDKEVPFLLSMNVTDLASIVMLVVVICFPSAYFLIIVAVVLLLFTGLTVASLPAFRQVRRMQSVTRSPVFTHFGETVSGAVSIRAFGATKPFMETLERFLDDNINCYVHSAALDGCRVVAIQALTLLLSTTTALVSVAGRDFLEASMAGLTLTYTMQMAEEMTYVVMMFVMLEASMVAVERAMDYFDLPEEAPWRNAEVQPAAEWPTRGDVTFGDYSAAYRDDVEPVLRHVNFQAQDGQKVGIVGRTGAGKSTLALALFRMIEPKTGSIVVDKVDIAKIGLHDLRLKMTIIPQDPVLFAGTLRWNLDPFDEHSDDAVWKALEQAHLKEHVVGEGLGLDYDIAEGGDNLSAGQRQLVCLARALLRQSKVLILDEATSSVDLATDQLVKETIHSEFQSTTMITIAHKLHTVMDCDKILVLAAGEVLEQGTPKELLEIKNGHFFTMARDAGVA
ncbi:multidrug resistance-associated protein 1 [Ixodes scapularis]|uniref:multidrug resistance-associated protein 1 n=1 Tax=Ixodes scapularis TaxID=6945 RepID=UPI001A9F5FDE|nr:multidrug resistance-associated protein 1 [Ixodes scapularis]